MSDQSSSSSGNDFLEGREIISTAVFSKQMWCLRCKIPLSLDLATKKVQKGFGRIYFVKCCKCSTVKKVYTDATFGNKDQFFTVNAKSAMGKYLSLYPIMK